MNAQLNAIEHGDELRANGYFLSEGNSLKELKLHFAWDIDVPKFTLIINCYMENDDYPEDLKSSTPLTDKIPPKIFN